jgi:hypothetical protein
MSEEPMRLIAEFDNEAEAEAAVALLKEAGIPVLTSRDEASASLFGQTPYELTGLAVPQSQEAEAQRVLAQLDGPLEPGWEQQAEQAVDGWLCQNCDTVVAETEQVCPECGTPRSEQPPEDSGSDQA